MRIWGTHNFELRLGRGLLILLVALALLLCPVALLMTNTMRVSRGQPKRGRQGFRTLPILKGGERARGEDLFWDFRYGDCRWIGRKSALSVDNPGLGRSGRW